MIRRNTIQCALVLEAVQRLKNHATADEVYEQIAAEHPSIGRGTVYRNLQRLSEEGEIVKVEVPDGATRYDHRRDAHYHVKCEQCGRVFDVQMKYMDGLEKKVTDPQGFCLTGHEIMFRGICPACQTQNEKTDGINPRDGSK